MVNADGDFVIAGPDKAAWEKFQAKAKTSAAKQDTAQDKEVAERGLECSIDKKMFVEPMKTPCCQKTFCNDCINNALIEGDLVCPACETENVLMDDLTPDEEAAKKIEEYMKEKEAAKAEAEKPKDEVKEETREGDKEAEKAEDRKSEDGEKPAEVKTDESNKTEDKEKSKSPVSQTAKSVSPPTGPKALVGAQDGAATKPGDSNPKKRPADDLLENPKIPKGPRAMQNQQNNQMPNMMNGMPNMGMMGMPPMGMPNMMNMPNMNMGGMPNMGMMGMPMMGMPGFNGNFNNGWDMNNMNMNMNMNGMGGMNGFNGMNGGNMHGGFQGNRPFNGQQGDEDAYFRKPVNPQRHQNKQRRARPSDYREL